MKTKERNKATETMNNRLIGIKHMKKMYVISMQEYRRTAYSDKNSKEKLAPEYSVLNPETSSDSDSAKSKGARCVSARVQMVQIGKNSRNRTEDCTKRERIE
jgi:hypothetical protein